MNKNIKGQKQKKKELKISYYFAHPYCSYERGSNENTNGLSSIVIHIL
ncbi:MAG: hypothetical protein AAB693_02635 [Patescibacteria group bacterium]